LRRLLFVAYFIEIGLLLILIPWSAFWERNYFIEGLPALRGLFHNNFVRGAVSGIGLINLWAGFADLAALFSPRRR
jgi:hypothetical protein